jgi:hypothetical protein
MPHQLTANCNSPRVVGARGDMIRVQHFATRRVFVVAFLIATCLATPFIAYAQEMVMPGMAPSVADAGAPPMMDSGGVNYFSQDLGTILRLRYNTESYGQTRGNFDIGTMRVMTFGDTATFLDGQMTMNDDKDLGFNLGVGYRWMAFPSFAPRSGRMEGVSFWVDGQRPQAHNFFPQIGVSYESLGELWDLRSNAYIPVGDQRQVGEFQLTGIRGFTGNSIGELTQAVVDTSFYAAELEVARRIGAQRDAWAFAGPYGLWNDDDDTAGARVGFRGYAYPDLLVQMAVSHDEIFNTNASFSIAWFVGRTRTNFQPACGVPDRFREPVMRNDYVVLNQSIASSGIALTNPDGSPLRIVHVNGNTATPGDGTFENPLAEQQLDEVQNFSQEGDIILAWAGSVFNGEGSVLLQDNQRFLGEGNDFAPTVNTLQDGTIVLPESSPGARNGTRPIIMAALGDAVTLADNNEVANFDFEDITGSAIAGTDLTGNANIHDIDVQDGGDFAISLTNVATTSTVTLDEFTYDGGTTGGGIQLNNFDGTFSATDSTLTNGTLAGVSVIDDSDGTITFQDTVEFTSIDGTTIHVDGDTSGVNEFGGTLTIASDIENDTGLSVSIQGVGAGSVLLNGDIADTGDGIRANSNGGGLLLFAGDLTLTTENSAAIQLTDNSDGGLTTIDFPGEINIVTTGGDGFVATGGGDLSVTNTGNTITTETGQVTLITDMTIDTLGVNFSEVNRTPGTGAASSAIELRDNTGGQIVFGDVTATTAGDNGTLTGDGADTVVIDNSANVTLNALVLNNAAGFSGVAITKDTTGTQTVNLNDLAVNNGDRGVDVVGNGTGTLNMGLNDTTITAATDVGLSINDIDAGTIAVVNTTVDGQNVGASRGVAITGSNATITFDSQSIVRENVGTDFEVDGGTGTISFAGDIINSSLANGADVSGRAVHIHDRTGGSVTFTSTSLIDVNNQGLNTNEGILVEDNSNNASITFQGDNNLNTGAFTAVTIQNNTGATMSLTGLDIDTTSGEGFVATGGGTLTVSDFSNTIDRTAGGATGSALRIEGMTIGAVDFERVTASGGAHGIRLVDNTSGTVTVGDTGNAANAGGTIDGTADAGVHAENTNVVLNGVTVTNAGDAAGENAVEIFHDDANAMNVNLNRLSVTNSGAAPSRNGVLIDGAGGTGTFNANVQNMSVTANGNGFVAQNGVTLTAGPVNTVATVNGVGLNLNNLTVAAAGANFQSVNVSAGTASGISMINVTGGQVQVGTAPGAVNSGGSLTTTGDAIVLSNVQNVDLRHIQVVNSSTGDGLDIDHTAAATTAMDVTIDDLNLDNANVRGIDLLADSDSFAVALKLTNSDIDNADVLMDVTGAGQFGLLVDSSDVTNDAVGRAFDLQFHGGATDGDVTIRNGSNFTATDGEALFVDSFDNTAKDIKLLVEDSTFTDITGTEISADIRNRDTSLMQVTIQGNIFSSASAPRDMVVQSSGTAASQVRLNLGGDPAVPADFNTAAGQGTLFVSQSGTSIFGIFERDDTLNDLRNNNPVDTNGGTFGDLATPPLLPTVPSP